MKTANVAEFKNQLSRFLALVVQGEEIKVRKHNVPLSRVVLSTLRERTVLNWAVGPVISCAEIACSAKERIFRAA